VQAKSQLFVRLKNCRDDYAQWSKAIPIVSNLRAVMGIGAQRLNTSHKKLDFREIKADLDIWRFCNSTRSDSQVHRCEIDLAQEAQQAKKETQHRRDEQQGHRNRRIKAQEGAQEDSSVSSRRK